MIERKTLYDGLSNAAWGYFFLNFDFNLGTVSILPRFMGFLMLFSAIRRLSAARQDLALLRPFCILLGMWAAGDWLLSWAGRDLDGHILFLDLLVSAAGLYFHFQFLTDMAALAEQYQPEDGDLDSRIRRRRTVYVICVTIAGTVPAVWTGRAFQQANTGLDVILGILGVVAVIVAIAAVFIMTALFELRRCFQEDMETGV